MSIFSQLLMQTFYYAIVLVIAIVGISFLQKGFFWAFIRVKTSFGKLILVKVRALNRDYYKVGKIEDGFLVYKHLKLEKRIAIKDRDIFYRSLGVLWVDTEETTNALAKTDYSVISGYDAVKYNDLYLRALYRPTIADNQDRLILGALFLILIGLVVLGIFMYMYYKELSIIKSVLASIRGGIVSPS